MRAFYAAVALVLCAVLWNSRVADAGSLEPSVLVQQEDPEPACSNFTFTRLYRSMYRPYAAPFSTCIVRRPSQP